MSEFASPDEELAALFSKRPRLDLMRYSNRATAPSLAPSPGLMAAVIKLWHSSMPPEENPICEFCQKHRIGK